MPARSKPASISSPVNPAMNPNPSVSMWPMI